MQATLTDSGVNRGPNTGASLYVIAVTIQYSRNNTNDGNEVWQCNLVAMNLSEAISGAVKWAKLQWPAHFRPEYNTETKRGAVQAYAVILPIPVDGVSGSVIMAAA
jgi:hypothetical protein